MMYVKMSSPQFISEGCLFVILLFVFIYVYWCPTIFRYHMMSESFNSNMTGTTSGEGTAHPSKVYPQFLWGSSCCSVFSFLGRIL